MHAGPITHWQAYNFQKKKELKLLLVSLGKLFVVKNESKKWVGNSRGTAPMSGWHALLIKAAVVD